MADTDRRGVFVSWSKPVSAEIATQIKPFLEDVLGSATIFMSQAMEGGTRWGMEIPQRLEACNAGLVLVTMENTHEPWLHFEAGALSKHVDESRVVPLLCGAAVGDIQGTPLSLFQAKSLTHDDFLAVCISFGSTFGIAEDAVRRRFDKGWPELESAVAKAIKAPGAIKRQLNLADLMAVLERVAGQVAGIETAVRYRDAANVLGALSGYTSGGMFGAKPPNLRDVLANQKVDLDSERFRVFLASYLARAQLGAEEDKGQHGSDETPTKNKKKDSDDSTK
jgi:hypothetical protein